MTGAVGAPDLKAHPTLAPNKHRSTKHAGRAAPSGAAPSKQTLIDFIKNADATVTRRDIARAFRVRGEHRRELRRLLDALADDGLIEQDGPKRFGAADNDLPPVAPIDVVSVDEDGDLVCLPASWRGDKAPPMIRIAAQKTARRTPAPGVGDRLLARLRPSDDDGYDAEIIKPIGKSARRFLAVFRRRAGRAMAEPVERRARNMVEIARADEGGARDGDLVWVETKNARGYGPGKARVRTIEGRVEDQNAFSLIALANHGIDVDFPKEVLTAADKARLPGLKDREDLRTTPLLTIDPADAMDHDDALWAAPDDTHANDGGWRVVVAIADVSHFVRAGDALDREARRRGNSTYLPDRVAPMLPERLSNDLCSLREGMDRPCLGVEMTLDCHGVKKSHRFFRAMMRSAAKLSYEDAQAIIVDKPKGDAISETVHALRGAYAARLKERLKRAPLDLELPERRIVLDQNGAVEAVKKRDRFDAHRLVEEFMILANVAAAETLEQARVDLIYRVHPSPDPEKLTAAGKYLDTLGYTLTRTAVRPSHFNQILKLAGERDQKEMISDVILRAQNQAVYATENLGHFGLNLARYAHFTSPIRRYADLTVHRALVRAAKLGAGGQNDAEAATLEKTAQSISDFERRSMAAEREAGDRYLASFLEGRIGAEFNGRIRGVTKSGLFVMLDETGADGFTPISRLGDERFTFVEEDHALIGDRSRSRYFLGQVVRVRLMEATPLTGGLRFDILTAPEAIKRTSAAKRGAPASRRKPSPRKAAKKRSKKNP